MPEFVATYDIRETKPAPHSRFIELANDRGWYRLVIDSTTAEIRGLPNTTLAKTADTMRVAVASFAAVVTAAKADISNFHIERVTIVGGGEVRAFNDGEAIRY